MIILPEFQKPYIIDSHNSPILPRYYWSFQAANLFDFTLSALTFIEENTSTVLKVLIRGLECYIPYNWYIMIADAETSQLDWIPINECIPNVQHAYLMSPSDSKTRITPIQVLDVLENQISYYPVIQKTLAMCHPVTKEINRAGVEVPLSIVIGQNDLSKYISNRLIGDLW